jgi:SAM-dependent methyltransferase
MASRRFNHRYFENPLFREKPNSPRNQKRLKEVLRHKSSGQLLEIGCAQGGFLALAEAHFAISGVDISEYAVRPLRERFGPDVKVLDIEKDALPRENYDIAVVFNVLEHLEDPSAVVDKIYASLRQDGVMVGSVPNNSGLVGRLATSIANILDRSHCSTFSPMAWRRIFSQAGFSSVEFFGELNRGRNHSVYIKSPFWKFISFGLMFVCRKYKI